MAIENANGTTGPDYILGDEDNNEIRGNTGNDTILGDVGNDRIDGEWNRDELYGEAGNDTLIGSYGDDTLDGGIGDDMLYGELEILGINAGVDIMLFAGSNFGFDTVYGGDSIIIDGDAVMGIEADLLFDDYGTGLTIVRGESTIRITDWRQNGDYGITLQSGPVVDKVIYGQKTLDGGVQRDVADYIVSGAGNDTIYADYLTNSTSQGYGDIIYSLGGNDVISMQGGADWVYAGSGNDLVNIGWNKDASTSAAEAKKVYLGSGNDTLSSSFVAHGIFAGEDGNDLMDRGLMGWISGGAGNDTINALGVGTVALGGDGDDTMSLISLSHDLTTYGGAVVDGGAGDNDTFIIGQRAQGIYEQTDVYINMDANVLQQKVVSGFGPTRGTYIGTSVDVINGLENVTIRFHSNDTIIGSVFDNRLDAGGGDDSIDGGLGHDTIIFGQGHDTVTGSEVIVHGKVISSTVTEYTEISGEATYDVASKTHRLDGFIIIDESGEGGITIKSMAGDFSVLLSDWDPTENRGYGITLAPVPKTPTVFDDSLTGSEDGDVIRMLDGNDTIDGLGGNDIIYGNGTEDVVANAGVVGGDNDSISGGVGDDILYGGPGDDTLNGNAGSSYLYGGKGNDTYYVNSSQDLVIENSGEGIDTILTMTHSWLPQHVENLTIAANLSLVVSGNDMANRMQGNIGNDIIRGGGGNDELFGMAGNDSLSGDSGDDTLRGGEGDDSYNTYDAGDKVIEAANQGIDTVYTNRTYTLGANLENLVLEGSEKINGGGNALANKITGGSGDNRLSGGDGDDTLIGAAGNDTLIGGSGANLLEGGSGDDVYTISNVSDIVVETTDGGVDRVDSSVTIAALAQHVENLTLTGTENIDATGNSLDNVIKGNAGNNVLSGGGGDDTVIGGTGNDTLNGGAGVNRLHGGEGDDVYVVNNTTTTIVEGAGQGFDTVRSSAAITLLGNIEALVLLGSDAVNGTGNAGANTLTGNSGDNSLWGQGGDDTIIGGSGADKLHGGSDNDSLSGGDGDDTLIGNDGVDTLDGGAGVNLLQGGLGGDVYYVSNETTTIHEAANGGIDLVRASASITLSVHVENLILMGTSANNGSGNTSDNSIIGNIGANSIWGLAGDDLISGNAGDDKLYGGAGNDTLDGSDGNDMLFGEAGDDTLTGGAGSNTLSGGADNDTYVVDNTTTTVYEMANQGVDTVKSSANITLLSNIEALVLIGNGAVNGTGNEGANTLTGNTGNNSLWGQDGDDTIIGDAGNDILTGGNGNDTITGGADNDTLSGDAGNDTLDGGSGTNFLQGGVGNDVYIVDNTTTTIYELANQGTDTVKATASITLLNNIETLQLMGENEINGTGNDGANTLIGNAAANSFWGQGGNDTIIGGAGDDRLNGGDGNDRITGGAGRDVMNGGAGKDVFVYTAASDSGVGTARDVIQGFSQADQDQIDLSAFTGTFSFAALAAYDSVSTTTEVRFITSGSNVIVQVDRTGDGVRDFEIQINGITTLTASDFIL